MDKNKEKRSGEVPDLLMPYEDQPWFKYFVPFLEPDEELMKYIAGFYPAPYLLRRYWLEVMYFFMHHVFTVLGMRKYCRSYWLRLRPPRKGSLAWCIYNMKDTQSALYAFLKYLRKDGWVAEEIYGLYDRRVKGIIDKTINDKRLTIKD